MEKEFKKAPDILTGKDLDYLKDIFGWNYTAYKFCEDAKQNLENKEILKIFNECSNFFYENMNTILGILEIGDQSE